MKNSISVPQENALRNYLAGLSVKVVGRTDLDLIQETIIRLTAFCDRRDTPPDGVELRRYARKVFINRFLDSLRKAKSERARVATHLDKIQIERNIAALTQETLSEIIDVIEKLPDSHRYVMHLYLQEVEEHDQFPSYAKMAKHLGVTPRQAEHRCRLALNAVRGLILSQAR